MIFETNNICLICYEKSDNFCHRHLVADRPNKNGTQYPHFQKQRGLILS